MAMTFPLSILQGDGRELGLVVAVVIGFFFGFVLERAGFGRATKLAAQFYFRDMTVFKVMFSAIVTAMLGLVVLSAIGLADLRPLSGEIASWTWIWPMLAGGILLGVGFIISGYCPGTSLVAAASGHVDGAVTFAGVVAGTFIYGRLLRFESAARFQESGEMGPLYLYDLIGVPPALLAALVALMAIAAFAGAERVERLFARRDGEASVAMPRQRRVAFATVAVLAVVSLATLGLSPRAAAPAGALEEISAAELAREIVDRPWGVRVIDVRSAAEFSESSVPGSERGELESLELTYELAGRRVVVVGDESLRELPPTLLAYGGEVFLLRGGYAAWRRFALEVPEEGGAGSDAPEEIAFRTALRDSLSGRAPAAPAPAPATRYVPKPVKKGGGCSA
jgi:rhodanese-related sulfurtransferase